MKSITISGSQREQVGKKDAIQLRRNGKVPCVLYGGEEELFFSADETGFKKLVYSPNVYTVKLDIKGKQYDAVLQEVQFHPVTDSIIHADFLELFEDKKIMMNIPTRIIGDSPGVMEGGQLIIKMRRIKIRALPGKLPDHVDVVINNLLIGGAIKVEDIGFEDLEFLDAPNTVIVRVKQPRELIEIEPPVEELEEGEEGEEGVEEGAEEGEEKKEEGAKEGAAEGASAKDGSRQESGKEKPKDAADTSKGSSKEGKGEEDKGGKK